jgi:hypothetical protein
MAECKKCKNSGWLLKIYGPGLCAECAKVFKAEVPQRVRIINDCLKIIKESRNLEIILSRFDLLIQQLIALSVYDQCGIHTIDFTVANASEGHTGTRMLSPTEFLKEQEPQKDLIILKTMRALVNEAIERSEVAATLTAKVNCLSKALLQVRRYKNQTSNPEAIASFESKILVLIQKAKFANMLDAANKAEFKGQRSKAVDFYGNVLYFLKNEADESLRNQFLSGIEAKIAELSSAKSP